MDLRIPLLKKDSGKHPLPLMPNAILKEVKVTHLNYDGAYALGTVTVRYLLSAKGRAVDTMLRIFTEGGSVDEKEETFVLRWTPRATPPTWPEIRHAPGDERRRQNHPSAE